MLGKLRDFQVKLYTDSDVKPVAEPHQRVPYSLQPKISINLQELEQNGIIKRVSGPTLWVLPIVCAPRKRTPMRYACVHIWELLSGMQPDQKRVQDIVDARPPKSLGKIEVIPWDGDICCQVHSRHDDNSLYDLTKSTGREWKWTEEQSAAFN